MIFQVEVLIRVWSIFQILLLQIKIMLSINRMNNSNEIFWIDCLTYVNMQIVTEIVRFASWGPWLSTLNVF